MSAALAVGLPATLAAGLCYGCAPVFQAIAARRQPPGKGLGLGLMAHLARQPLWLLGLLAEMAGFGLPVPPGFTITTEVCTYYYAHGRK